MVPESSNLCPCSEIAGDGAVPRALMISIEVPGVFAFPPSQYPSLNVCGRYGVRTQCRTLEAKSRLHDLVFQDCALSHHAIFFNGLRCGLAHCRLQPGRPNQYRHVGIKSGSLTNAKLVRGKDFVVEFKRWICCCLRLSHFLSHASPQGKFCGFWRLNKKKI